MINIRTSTAQWKSISTHLHVGGSNPRGSRNLSHGKLSKIDPLILKSH